MIAQDLQQRIDAYRGNPGALEQRFQQSQQLIDLLALQKIKSEKEAAARAMQLQMAQAAPPTVAEQREQEVMDMTRQEVAQRIGQVGQQQVSRQQDALKKLMGGIAGAPGAQAAMPPQAMAAGGIVAFQAGGSPEEQMPPAGEREYTEEELQRLRDLDMDEMRRLMRRYPRPAPRSLAEAQDRLREEKGSIYNSRFGELPGEEDLYRMTPAEREAAQIRRPGGVAQVAERERPIRSPLSLPTPRTEGLAQVLEQQRPIPSALTGISEAAAGIPAALERARERGSFERYAREAAGRIPSEGEMERMPMPDQRAPGVPGGGPAGPGITAALQMPQVQRPQMAPRPQSLEQGLGGLGQIATPPRTEFTDALQRRVLGELGTDLEAAAEARRKKAAEAMGYTPDERKKLEGYIEELERMDRERFSPEAQRRRALEDFIAGAARSTSNIGSLGAGAAAVTAGERAMGEEMRKALQERLSKRETMIERERSLREKAFGSGEKAYEEASRRVGAAMQAGATLQSMEQNAIDNATKRATDLAVAGINRDSAERVAQLQADVNFEIAKATRENTLEVKRQSLMQQIERAEDRSLSDLYRSPEGQALTALLKQQGEAIGLNAKQKAELERLQGVMRQAERRVRQESEVQRQMLMGTGGFSLAGVRKE